MEFPAELEVRIDTSRGGFVKRRDDGGVDFVSPLPCPFNYGSAAGTRAPDGEREDAIVLGGRLDRGSSVRVAVLGRVRFVDGGVDDHKWLCGEALHAPELIRVRVFFWVYAHAKRVMHAMRGEFRATRFEGIETWR